MFGDDDQFDASFRADEADLAARLTQAANKIIIEGAAWIKGAAGTRGR